MIHILNIPSVTETDSVSISACDDLNLLSLKSGLRRSEDVANNLVRSTGKRISKTVIARIVIDFNFVYCHGVYSGEMSRTTNT